VVQAFDPAIKEQQEKEAFGESIKLEDELDYIFAVLEKSGATTSNFRKGVEHFFAKIEAPLTKVEVYLVMKKALFARAFGEEHTIARTVAAVFFILEVIRHVPQGVLSHYIGFHYSDMEPFVKDLYGFAGHAFNYQYNRSVQGDYQTMTPDVFADLIERCDELQAYTDRDPFAVDTVRKKWAQDLYDAPLQMVRSSELGKILDKEEYVDAMCYFAYTAMCEDPADGVEEASIEEIASVYRHYMEKLYEGIGSRS